MKKLLFLLAISFCSAIGAKAYVSDTIIVPSLPQSLYDSTVVVDGSYLVDTGYADHYILWSQFPFGTGFTPTIFIDSVTGNGNFSDTLRHLPLLALYFEEMLVNRITGDTVWSMPWIQTPGPHPYAPSIHSASGCNTTQVLFNQTYNFDCGNVPANVVLMIKIGAYTQAVTPVSVSGIGSLTVTSPFLGSNVHFSTWTEIQNFVDSTQSDTTIAMTSPDSLPAHAALNFIHVSHDTIFVSALITSFNLATTPVLHYSATGVNDSIVAPNVQSQGFDTVVFALAGTELTMYGVYVCATNSLGGNCTNTVYATTDVEFETYVDTAYAIGLSTARVIYHYSVPTGFTAHLSDEFANNASFNPYIVLGPMLDYGGSGTVVIDYTGLSNGATYYAKLFGWCDDGESVNGAVGSFVFNYTIPTGILELSSQDFQMFCDGRIATFSAQAEGMLSVYNSNGALVSEERIGKAKLDLPSGIYFYRFETDGHVPKIGKFSVIGY